MCHSLGGRPWHPWPVEPGQYVGPFVLGMGVNEALSIVQKMGSLEVAEFSFDERRLFDIDLSLRMPALGFQLCFDGYQQDLRVICISLQRPDTEGCIPQEHASQLARSAPDLAYLGKVFAGAEPVLGLQHICKLFGPTWIGEFRKGDAEAGASYHLQYRGLTFEFPLPGDMVEQLATLNEHPMQIPGRAAPTASRMWVFPGSSSSYTAPAPALPDLPEAVVVRPAVGVEMRGRCLRFGSMPQDVFSDFGPPEQVCVKDVDAVRIHGEPRGQSSRLMPPLDYYYNYFHLGLDVLFDGRTHMVKKVVLHTNPPTHELFSRYSRCFFQIPIAEPVPTAAPLAPSEEPASGQGVEFTLQHPGDDVLSFLDDEPPMLHEEPPAALPCPADPEGLQAAMPAKANEDDFPADLLGYAAKHSVIASDSGEDDKDEAQRRMCKADQTVLNRMREIRQCGTGTSRPKKKKQNRRTDPLPLLPKARNTREQRKDDAPAASSQASEEAPTSLPDSKAVAGEGNTQGSEENATWDDGSLPLDFPLGNAPAAGTEVAGGEDEAAARSEACGSEAETRGAAAGGTNATSAAAAVAACNDNIEEDAVSAVDEESAGSGREVLPAPVDGDREEGIADLDADASCSERRQTGVLDDGVVGEAHVGALPWILNAPGQKTDGEVCAAQIVQASPSGPSQGAPDDTALRWDDLPPPALPLEPGKGCSELASSPAAPEAHAAEESDGVCVNLTWPWSEIQHVMGHVTGFSGGKPLIMNQGGGHTPFGSTHFYAFPGLAFEVMQNGFLASLTVFSVPTEELPAVFLPERMPSKPTSACAAP